MTQSKIQCELRLYFLGRIDYETEYFAATCPTDMMTQAKTIAKSRKANHFNIGPSLDDKEQHRNTERRRHVTIGPSNMRDQVAAIEEAIGKPRINVFRGRLEP
jgi:hypothetical protein